jgi:hypothetical protein
MFEKKNRGRADVAQTMYTHVSKCKNDKIKKMKKKKKCIKIYDSKTKKNQVGETWALAFTLGEQCKLVKAFYTVIWQYLSKSKLGMEGGVSA